jgi:hypothetical protein
MALSVSCSVVYWYLLVHPEVVLLTFFSRGTDEEDLQDLSRWEPDPKSLRAAQWAFGCFCFSLSFGTGLLVATILTQGHT